MSCDEYDNPCSCVSDLSAAARRQRTMSAAAAERSGVCTMILVFLGLKRCLNSVKILPALLN